MEYANVPDIVLIILSVLFIVSQWELVRLSPAVASESRFVAGAGGRVSWLAGVLIRSGGGSTSDSQ